MVRLPYVTNIGERWVEDVNGILANLRVAEGAPFSSKSEAILPVAGVYVIVDSTVTPIRVLYVGESSDLRRRFRQHKGGPTGSSQFRKYFVRAKLTHMLGKNALSKDDERTITERISILHFVFAEVPEPVSQRRGSRRLAIEAILTELLAPGFGADENTQAARVS